VIKGTEEVEGEEEIRKKTAVTSIYSDVVLKRIPGYADDAVAFYVKMCRNVQLVRYS
jgi:hypothetical protein